MRLSLQRLKRILTYFLLALFTSVLIPTEWWHDHHDHEVDCDESAMHIDDKRHVPDCDICAFQLPAIEGNEDTSELIVITLPSVVITYESVDVPAEFQSTISSRGPPIMS